MSLTVYQRVLVLPGVTRLLTFAVFARIPAAATSVVLTFWVVLGLGQGYAAAGLVVACLTAGAGAGAPLLGRLLDRIGLRRTILPLIFAEGIFYALVPLIGYAALVPAALVAGLLSVPIFTVIRQSIAALVPPARQAPAFMLDSIGTEVTFVVAPAAGVLLATQWSVTGAVIILGIVTVAASVALFVVNPPLTTPKPSAEVLTPIDTPAEAGELGDLLQGTPGPAGEAQTETARWRLIFTPEMILVLIATAAALGVLGGTEVSVVARLREFGRSELSSLVFIIWSVASAIGGFLLGARKRQLPVFGLLLALGLLTVPVGLLPGPQWLLLTIIPTGFFCAPTLSATASRVSLMVPERVRGEAMGWYGTSMTAGLSLGAPLAGICIDRIGAWAGFAVIGTVGVVVAVVALVLIPLYADRPGSSGPGATSGASPTRHLRPVA